MNIFKFLKRKFSKVELVVAPVVTVRPTSETIHEEVRKLVVVLLGRNHRFDQYSQTRLFPTPGKSIEDAISLISLLRQNVRRYRSFTVMDADLAIVNQTYKGWFALSNRTLAPANKTMEQFLMSVSALADTLLDPKYKDKSTITHARFVTTNLFFGIYHFLSALINERTL